jgi:hypothetical protein
MFPQQTFVIKDAQTFEDHAREEFVTLVAVLIDAQKFAIVLDLETIMSECLLKELERQMLKMVLKFKKLKRLCCHANVSKAGHAN